jgi:hypothetical protein
MKKMMTQRNDKPLFLAATFAALLFTGTWAQAQEESAVVLPLEAQTCDLPTAPPRIPEDADYDALVEAKQLVQDFQAAMVLYRGCLDNTKGLDTLTDGNRTALTQAHNYSVEMEERIAEQFNVAVRNYKAQKAAAE